MTKRKNQQKTESAASSENNVEEEVANPGDEEVDAPVEEVVAVEEVAVVEEAAPVAVEEVAVVEEAAPVAVVEEVSPAEVNVVEEYNTKIEINSSVAEVSVVATPTEQKPVEEKKGGCLNYFLRRFRKS